MRCPVCDRPAEVGQRFCTGCGTALRQPAPGEATSLIAAQPAADAPAGQASRTTDDTPPVTPRPGAGQPGPVDAAAAEGWAEPVWAPTGSVPTTPAPTTAQLPATQPIAPQPVETELPVRTPYDYSDDATTVVHAPTGTTTTVLPGFPEGYPDPYAARRPGHFRFNAVLVLGVATGLVALVTLFTDILTIRSSRPLTPTADAPPDFAIGVWMLDDLAGNLSVAGLLAAVVMVAGGIASGFGWKWGGGLAGGGGLAFGGLAAIAIGLAQMPIDAAHEFARIPADPPFTLTITRDVGYHLLIVAAALGLVLFFTSFNDFRDPRTGLNPWIAALGGLATVIACAGPLLPEGIAPFSDNWYLVEAPGEPPAMLLVGRAVQLAALLVTGVLGFLSVRRYGVGLAVGGALPVIWLAASTMFELTDRPVGPAFRNPGSAEMDLHGVTVIGVAALASMLLLAVVAAYDQTVRERP